ncbi:hypothetical protein D521_1568 [beta proteobacterium CB]|nr:hypothetical protein D521_1568 [beta proteobacterium CB]
MSVTSSLSRLKSSRSWIWLGESRRGMMSIFNQKYFLTDILHHFVRWRMG